MSYKKTSLDSLIFQVHTNLISSLRDSDPELRDSMISVISKVFGGSINGCYSRLEWQTRQMFPDIADDEWVEKWGTLKRLFPLTASIADGSITIVGTVGKEVPENTILRRQDGTLYKTTQVAVIPAEGFIGVTAEAMVFGTIGNSNVGEELTFVSVPAGISSTATVLDMTGGTENETKEEYRQRVVESFSLPARGGSSYDYGRWVKEATDATNVWVYGWHPSDNPQGVLLGDVLILFMMYRTYEDGIPQAGDLTDVSDYIEPIRPKGMGTLHIEAPVKELLNFNLRIYPDTAENRQQVTVQLDEFIKRKSIPNGTLHLSGINEAISRAIGVEYHNLISPSSDVQTAEPRNIFSIGTITWS